MSKYNIILIVSILLKLFHFSVEIELENLFKGINVVKYNEEKYRAPEEIKTDENAESTEEYVENTKWGRNSHCYKYNEIVHVRFQENNEDNRFIDERYEITSDDEYKMPLDEIQKKACREDHLSISIIGGLRHPKTEADYENYQRFSLLPVTPTNKQLYWSQIKNAVFAGFISLIKEHVPFKNEFPASVNLESIELSDDEAKKISAYDCGIKMHLKEYVRAMPQYDVLRIQRRLFFGIYDKKINDKEDKDYFSLTNEERLDILDHNVKHQYIYIRFIAYFQRMFLIWAYEAFGKLIDFNIIKELNIAFEEESKSLKKKEENKSTATLAKDFDEIIKILKSYDFTGDSNSLTKYKHHFIKLVDTQDWLDQIIITKPLFGEANISYKLRMLNQSKYPLTNSLLRFYYSSFALFPKFYFQPNTYAGFILKLIFACPKDVLDVIVPVKRAK